MFNGKHVSHIVCIGANGEIGKDNNLIFKISEDLKFFKKMTLGGVVLMGRKTIESIPNGLKKRIVIHLSRKDWMDSYSDDLILHAAMIKAESSANLLNVDQIFIAGGSSVYDQTFKYADSLYVTHVHHEFEGADSFYNIPEDFVFSGIVSKRKTSQEGLDFSIYKYERVIPCNSC